MLIEISDNLYDKLTTTEKIVFDYINDNEEKLVNMSIVEVADETYTSIATVSRCIKKCGLNGFSELRYKILNNTKGNVEYKAINNILEKSLIEVKKTIENISVKDIVDAIKIIQNSKRIYILARGLSELVASEFDLKLKILGYNSFFITDPKIMENISTEIKSNECVLIFSLRGKTSEIVNSVVTAKDRGCKIVSCCCEKNSKLSKLSDVALIGVKHKKISIKKYEVTSRIPLQVISRAIIDYLIINN